jgi:sortase B
MKKEKLPGETRKKRPFWQSWIPYKGDSPRQVTLKILTLVLLLVFLGSTGYLVNELLILPAQADSTVDEIRSVYHQTEDKQEATSSGESSSVPQEDPREAIRKLAEINLDIKGWVTLPGTVIDYPVLQSSEDDPEYYLYRDYKKNQTKYGSVFLQAGTALDGSDQNRILYGHSMKDGRMFAGLLKMGEMDVYKQSPVITFDTTQEAAKWKIISVFKTNTRKEQGAPFQYLISHFDTQEEYLDFVYQVRQRSIIDTGVDFRADDTLLTLSTCSYEFDDFRTVVVARKVREGEDPTVDTAKASYNKKVVYPDCWYRRYGGSRPQWPETLDEAVEQGLAPWYVPAEEKKPSDS